MSRVTETVDGSIERALLFESLIANPVRVGVLSTTYGSFD
jgi:hypothetical protein